MFQSIIGFIVRGVLAGLISTIAFGQLPSPAVSRPSFEVASVKRSGPPQPGLRFEGLLQGGPGTSDPARITDLRVTLQRLIREAYGVDFDQIQGPAWIAEEKYDIIANVPRGATKEQVKPMLQSLLEERFKLAFHRVIKDFPVYELTIAKGGSKLKENTNSMLEPSRPGDPMMPPDSEGFPQLPPGKWGMTTLVVNRLSHTTARGIPLSSLISALGLSLATITGANTYAEGRIVDKTGLTGRYDFHLEYGGLMGRGMALTLPAELLPGPSYLEAIEKQLGLKLTKSKAPFEVLTIDHVERIPTEN